MIRFLLPSLVLLAACRPPAEAPEEYSALVTWLYEHHADEDPEAMEVGLASLAAWLDAHWAEAEDEGGYTIDPIGDATADSLDGTDRAVAGLEGLAVATRSVHTVQGATEAMLVPNLMDVYPEMFVEYERTIPEAYDLDCFIDRACDRIEAGEQMRSEFALGVESSSQAYNQYLWVEVEGGAAMVQRNWLVVPPEVTGPFSEMLQVDAQYYLNLFMPRDGGFLRLQATWMIYTVSDDLLDTALNLAVDNMLDNSAWLDDYLAAQ